MDKITVSIIGPGSRGFDTYGRYCQKRADVFEIVSILGHTQQRLNYVLNELGLSIEAGFIDEEEFFKQKRSDLIIIASPDACHYRHLAAALKLGYDVLMEKPVCNSTTEYLNLIKLQNQYHNKVMIGYVLRYLPEIQLVEQMIRNGEIGQLRAIQAMEQVHATAFVHSYVRGRWARQEDTSSTLLAKCSHDLDLIDAFVHASGDYFVGDTTSSTTKTLSFSSYFKPKAAATRCIDCDLDCPYDATRAYLENWYSDGKPVDQYPYNTICQAPVTHMKIVDALQHSTYGLCIGCCDNDATDFENVDITYYHTQKPDTIQVGLTMNGLSMKGGRLIKIYGLLGEIDYDEENDAILVKGVNGSLKRIPISTYNTEGGYSHSKADDCMMEALVRYLQGNEEACLTTLQSSFTSHLVGFVNHK